MTSADDSENWKGWEDYMGSKMRKLNEQLTEASNVGGQRSLLFQNVVVFVNGYTNPSVSILKDILLNHGGQLHTYQTPAVTHYVASQLPHSKIVQLKPGQRIIKPSWITQSLKQMELLPETDFLLYSGQAGATGLDKFVCKQPENSDKQSTESETTTCSTGPSTSGCIPKTTDPNFLNDFYSNSRLHFISTLAQDMKDFVETFRRMNKNACYTGRHKLLGGVAVSAEMVTIYPRSPVVGQHTEDRSPCFMHVDMDCFFVSASLLSFPHLKGSPVVVTHSKGKKPQINCNGEIFESYAEIASCSYEARRYGVKNGMLLKNARKLCPVLQFVPYDFATYRSVSQKLYETVLSFTRDVEAVSCDECFVDAGSVCRDCNVTPERFGTVLREAIIEATSCPVSIGIGPNLLLARMATRKAKPNRLFQIQRDAVQEFMALQPVKDLPGVGRATLEKFIAKNVVTCGDLGNMERGELARMLGPNMGQQLFNFARGIDNRTLKLTRERKSVSCDVNYGIRLVKVSEAEHFLQQLSNELSERLKKSGLKGRQIVLKLMIRSSSAPTETLKFLGHGDCDVVNKSSNLRTPTDDAAEISRAACVLLGQIGPSIIDIRGIGITMIKLCSQEAGRDEIVEKSVQKLFETRNKTSDVCVNGVACASDVLSTTKCNEKFENGISEKNHLETLPGDTEPGQTDLTADWLNKLRPAHDILTTPLNQLLKSLNEYSKDGPSVERLMQEIGDVNKVDSVTSQELLAFFGNLINDWHFAHARKLVLNMTRCSQHFDNNGWHELICEVVNVINSAMYQLYGGEMLL